MQDYDVVLLPDLRDNSRMVVYSRPQHVSSATVYGIIKIFWQHMMRYRALAFFLTCAIFLLHVGQIAVPWYYKQFFDTLFIKSEPTDNIVSDLVRLLIVIALLKLAIWGMRRSRGFLSTAMQSRVMADLNLTSFTYLIRHSYRFFADNFAGSLTRKVNRLSRAYEDIVDQTEFALLPLIIQISGILLVLGWRSAVLSVILFLGVAVFLIFHIFFARWKQKFDMARAAKDSETTGVLADALTNIHNIHLFTGYRQERARYREINAELRSARALAWNLGEGMDAVQGFVMLALELTMLYAAILLWRRGILTVGDFVLIQLYLLVLFERIGDFGRVLRRLFEGFADASEMVEILNSQHEVKDIPAAKNLLVKNAKIEFNEVDFSFHQTRKVLAGFNLTIASGEKVALVGPSGAGKTTVVRLLFRFYDIDHGVINIDGQNIARVTQDSLRDHIALVPQEPVLFHRTLRENILYGRSDASDDEVVEAAKKARCHDFISMLPYGYDTYVGERGVKLSGGERQRVAIARAILKNAQILVLDEATSSLDSESEALIQAALKELMQGKTVIVIAHRLSTVMQMDRIVVIDRGKVTTTGTHEELLRTEGTYKRLWEIQAGGFVGL